MTNHTRASQGIIPYRATMAFYYRALCFFVSLPLYNFCFFRTFWIGSCPSLILCKSASLDNIPFLVLLFPDIFFGLEEENILSLHFATPYLFPSHRTPTSEHGSEHRRCCGAVVMGCILTSPCPGPSVPLSAATCSTALGTKLRTPGGKCDGERDRDASSTAIG